MRNAATNVQEHHRSNELSLGRWLGWLHLPAVWASPDIRVIAVGVVAVISPAACRCPFRPGSLVLFPGILRRGSGVAGVGWVVCPAVVRVFPRGRPHRAYRKKHNAPTAMAMAQPVMAKDAVAMKAAALRAPAGHAPDEATAEAPAWGSATACGQCGRAGCQGGSRQQRQGDPAKPAPVHDASPCLAFSISGACTPRRLACWRTSHRYSVNH